MRKINNQISLNNVKIYIFFLFQAFFTFYCTHHTAIQQYANPPYIVSVTQIGTGVDYEIKVRAINMETVFAGYTLYTGSTEAAATAKPNGTPCTQLTIIPNVPTEFLIEASLNPGAIPARCNFPVSLNSGDYILIRSQIISIQLDSGTSHFVYSPPSNIAKVP